MIAAQARPTIRAAALVWPFAALLVAWGNASAILLGPTAVLPGGSVAFALAGIALAAASLAVARALRLNGHALGLRGPHLRGALLGAALGGVVSAAGVLALELAAPLIVGHPVAYAPLARVDGAELLRHVAVLLPLGVILPEEVAFRGVLVGALARALDERVTIAAAAVSFALWHTSIVFATVGETTIGPGSPWAAVGVIGAFAVIAAGGALFAWLRLRTGTLATTIVAHWSFNVVLLAGLWLAR